MEHIVRTLKYLITIHHLLNVHKGETPLGLQNRQFQFDVVELICKAFGINLIARHVNGMTPSDLAVHSRLLDNLEKGPPCLV